MSPGCEVHAAIPTVPRILDGVEPANTAAVRVKGKWHVYPEQAAAGLWTTPRDLALPHRTPEEDRARNFGQDDR